MKSNRPGINRPGITAKPFGGWMAFPNRRIRCQQKMHYRQWIRVSTVSQPRHRMLAVSASIATWTKAFELWQNR